VRLFPFGNVRVRSRKSDVFPSRPRGRGRTEPALALASSAAAGDAARADATPTHSVSYVWKGGLAANEQLSKIAQSELDHMGWRVATQKKSAQRWVEV